MLKKTQVLKPCEQPENVEEMRDRFIQKYPRGVVNKVHEGTQVKNCMFFLQDKHYYKSDTFTGILTKAEIYKLNSKYCDFRSNS